MNDKGKTVGSGYRGRNGDCVGSLLSKGIGKCRPDDVSVSSL